MQTVLVGPGFAMAAMVGAAAPTAMNAAPITTDPMRRMIVTIRHNPWPIDSPVPRSTIREIRMADHISDADQTTGNDQDAL